MALRREILVPGEPEPDPKLFDTKIWELYKFFGLSVVATIGIVLSLYFTTQPLIFGEIIRVFFYTAISAIVVHGFIFFLRLRGLGLLFNKVDYVAMFYQASLDEAAEAVLLYRLDRHKPFPPIWLPEEFQSYLQQEREKRKLRKIKK